MCCGAARSKLATAIARFRSELTEKCGSEPGRIIVSGLLCAGLPVRWELWGRVKIFHVGSGLELAPQIVVYLELTLAFWLRALLAKPNDVIFRGRRETAWFGKKLGL